MDLTNSIRASARHDSAEQRGDGVRELHQRFQDATTSAAFEEIAAEGELRRGRGDLPPPVETAYDVVISLARQRTRTGRWGVRGARRVIMKAGAATMRETIVFVCPHNAAKSVIAAAYFQQRADQFGLALRAVSAGTEPSPAMSAAVVEVLRKAGIDVAGYQPRLVTPEELATAARVVSLGSDLHAFALAPGVVDDWNDVPPPSQDLGAACQAIRARVERLVTELQVAGTTP